MRASARFADTQLGQWLIEFQAPGNSYAALANVIGWDAKAWGGLAALTKLGRDRVLQGENIGAKTRNVLDAIVRERGKESEVKAWLSGPSREQLRAAKRQQLQRRIAILDAQIRRLRDEAKSL